ncbi:helix-turn-helix transcriptional regulator [Xenorhabdus innexi]|uniref:LuxR family transcriptional regulator n=1 Tax=Xenorhabdus innexi TaxID=290109 RepID=A0A1N6N1E6_9GAMM|nr:PAS domain-containing protein [Xenorhabdus innexi]PHM36946.1 LuxR family transcriptional regulator [Xenorhabdus innexi]SIP74854.1 conserved hypothetical protein [Xenorhabdus innexi]
MNKITPQLTNIWDKSHESWFVKDKKLRFIYANKAFIELNNLPDSFDIIDYTERELVTPFRDLIHLFEDHDQKVLQSMQRISSIGTYFQPNTKKLIPYSCEKYPLMSESNKCMGIIGHIKEINHFSVHNYLKRNISTSINLNPPSNVLTEKEWLIIFLFCRGVNNKLISEELNISRRTLERYFKVIYEKLCINSTIELKTLCEKNNYDQYIPSQYFKSISHNILY